MVTLREISGVIAWLESLSFRWEDMLEICTQ